MNTAEITPEIIERVVRCVDRCPDCPGMDLETWKAMRSIMARSLADNSPEHMVAIFREIVSTVKDTIRRDIIKELAPEGSVSKRFGILQGQCFTFEYPGRPQITWSIEVAKHIIGDRHPATDISLAAARIALARNELAKEISDEWAMTRDLSEPLIAVESPWEAHPNQLVLVIIDGWHRLRKMDLTNHEQPLPVHVLLREEEEMCRIERMQ